MIKNLYRILIAALCVAVVACTSDDPDNPDRPDVPQYPDNTVSDNDSEVTVYDDGSTSTGALFSKIDDYNFWLDGIRYSRFYSELEIAEADPSVLKGDVRPYAVVIIGGNRYATEKVGAQAFRNCSRMTSCSLPKGVKEIVSGDETGAFTGASSLRAVFFPESIRKIGDMAFAGCDKLEVAFLPDGVENVGVKAFRDCSSLKALDIPESLRHVGLSAYAGCKSLTLLDVKFDKVVMGDGVFQGCTGLRDVNLSSTMSIGSYMFAGCTSLKSLVLSPELMMIGVSSFSGCTSLENLVVPAGRGVVFNSAFSGCTGLKTLKLCGSTSIRDNVFAGCKSLVSVTCMTELPPDLTDRAFSGLPSNAVLYVPANSVPVYQSSGWGIFFNNIRAIAE